MLYERKKDMFIARENEINELEAKYQTGNFEFVIIYGRRRIGKTRLIEEFTKDKECIFFSAMKDGSRNESLIQLSKCISGSESDDFPIFPSFQSAFHKIAGMALDRRIVFVIDEFPYLEDNDGYFSSLLQNTIDREFKKTKLFLIISGYFFQIYIHFIYRSQKCKLLLPWFFIGEYHLLISKYRG